MSTVMPSETQVVPLTGFWERSDVSLEVIPSPVLPGAGVAAL